MKYSVTGVVGPNINKKMEKISLESEMRINAEFCTGDWNALQLEIVYCPIILSAKSKSIYPSRTFFGNGKKVLYCGPHLNYDVFVSGEEAQIRKEFYLGIKAIIPFLSKAKFSEGLTIKLKKMIENLAAGF